MSDQSANKEALSEGATLDMTESLLTDLQQLIHSARERVASAVNSELTLLYWRIGQRLRTETLRADKPVSHDTLRGTLSR